MPFIHIRSLPFDRSIDISTVVEGITFDFAAATGIDPERITVTWVFFAPGRYAVAGRTVSHQPDDSHPVLIDLMAPDFNPSETIEKMLRSLASIVSGHTDVPVQNIFINYRPARSGTVFDAGEVVRW